jgi:hypothetical protein
LFFFFQQDACFVYFLLLFLAKKRKTFWLMLYSFLDHLKRKWDISGFKISTPCKLIPCTLRSLRILAKASLECVEGTSQFLWCDLTSPCATCAFQ